MSDTGEETAESRAQTTETKIPRHTLLTLSDTSPRLSYMNTNTNTTTPPTFIPGNTYVMRSVSDHGAIWHCEIITRTAKRVSLRVTSSDGQFPELKTVKVSTDEGFEVCQPLGRYSRSPILSAAKLSAKKV